MVHTAHRGAGVGKRLINEIEKVAKQEKRHLLVLDTRYGDAASNLYRASGFIEVGQIPEFALSASGRLDATSYFYKRI